MKVTVDGKTFIIRKNEAVLTFPNQIHSLESVKSRHILCIFAPRLVQAFSTKIWDKIPLNNKFTPDKYLINALENLTASSSSAEKKGLLYSLCGQFDKLQSIPKKSRTAKNCFIKFSLL